ncbi:dihydropteroate synthase [Actinobacillus pleuropneumoniae]|uniref:Pterin-binding domain-containing protein n=1 Tax=Pasteurella multocida TaxID=747 RepID=Q51924_PASMD|nr:ORF78; N-terminal region has homology to sulphonamide resistant protein SulII; sulII homolog [Pasteurella multocida]AFF25523.1 hypothetical protein PMCN06_p01 [Pasteurella multocida subsp. multocida str. HN06]KIE94667.1 hypothetical protein AP780_03058 [Actinobacillus pleuropneumoniae]
MNKSLIIFGIVNITSDSFSDGGRYLAPDAAIAQARKLMAEGADVIDLMVRKYFGTDGIRGKATSALHQKTEGTSIESN